MTKIIFIILLFISLFLNFNCKQNPITPPPKEEPDTTSHSFTWQTFEFGDDGASPSSLKDVAIINDSDIWAVGSVYLNDSTGQPDYNAYNAIHWGGIDWKLNRINMLSDCNPVTYSSLKSILAFSDSNIVLTSGGSIGWFNGITNIPDCSIRPILTGSIRKFWKGISNDLYSVGSNGNITHYNNGNWDKMASGTSTDLTDIWGNNDGKSIWACGYAMDYSQSSILKFDGTTWKTIWSSNAVNTPPYGYLVSTIWAGDKYLYVGAGDGIYRTPLNGSDTTKKVLPLQLAPYRIRGSAENNIAVSCSDGSIWHYNGATWFQETPSYLQRPVKPLYSIAVSENTIVAVGVDAETTDHKGRILIGRRN